MTAILLLMPIALAGCGSATGLKPAANASLPPKPYGAIAAKTPAELTTPSNQARPARSDELLRTSEQRRGDEFDLPPTR